MQSIEAPRLKKSIKEADETMARLKEEKDAIAVAKEAKRQHDLQKAKKIS